MSKINLMFGLLVSSAMVFGQKGPISTDQMAQKHAEKMKYTLDLSNEQAKKIETVDAKYLAELKVQREELAKKQAEIHAKMKGIKEAQKNEYKKILTEEQFTKMMKNYYSASRGGYGFRSGDAPCCGNGPCKAGAMQGKGKRPGPGMGRGMGPGGQAPDSPNVPAK